MHVLSFHFFVLFRAWCFRTGTWPADSTFFFWEVSTHPRSLLKSEVTHLACHMCLVGNLVIGYSTYHKEFVYTGFARIYKFFAYHNLPPSNMHTHRSPCYYSHKIHLRVHRFINLTKPKLLQNSNIFNILNRDKQDQIYSFCHFWSTKLKPHTKCKAILPLYWSLTWSGSQIQFRKHFGRHHCNELPYTMQN